jgi:hypothetical protein
LKEVLQNALARVAERISNGEDIDATLETDLDTRTLTLEELQDELPDLFADSLERGAKHAVVYAPIQGIKENASTGELKILHAILVTYHDADEQQTWMVEYDKDTLTTSAPRQVEAIPVPDADTVEQVIQQRNMRHHLN